MQQLRCLQEADTAAAAIMTTTEGAVKTELEAKGIYEQVRLAVEAAQRGKMDQLASSQQTVDIDWDSSDEKPHAVPEEKDSLDQHHRVPLLWLLSAVCLATGLLCLRPMACKRVCP